MPRRHGGVQGVYRSKPESTGQIKRTRGSRSASKNELVAVRKERRWGAAFAVIGAIVLLLKCSQTPSKQINVRGNGQDERTGGGGVRVGRTLQNIASSGQGAGAESRPNPRG